MLNNEHSISAGFMVTIFAGNNGDTIKDTLNGTKDVTKDSLKIFLIIKKNPQITIPELAKMINVNERTIKRHISILKNKNYIKRIGGRKDGYWQTFES